MIPVRTLHPGSSLGIEQRDMGGEVMGSEVMRSEVMGNEVMRSEVMGNDVMGHV